ncbi:MAG: DUF389 domain-containing protein, partial [Candidatus Dormibacteraeota bacterium]|nr:DUF389 domain-containing protein [Candidatus Dormibacteraeota bacterium]
TTARSMSLVGVFISVTTVPAAGNAAVALALANWGEVLGSVEQLALNLSGMIAAGMVTLVVLRFGWSLVPERTRHAARHRVARRRTALR